MPRLKRWPMRLVIPALCLTRCATAPSDPGPVCPALVPYSMAQQTDVANALDALPPASPLRLWLQDYIALRAQVRACLPD